MPLDGGSQIRKFMPGPFVPTSALTGTDRGVIFQGEGVFVKWNRWGEPYALGYSGHLDMSETVATKTLAGSISWAGGSLTVTGSGTAFKTELRPGSFVFGDGGANATVLLVVEDIASDTSFTCCFAPKTAGSAKSGYVMSVIQALGTRRATMYRGKVAQTIKGSYIGVGDGEVKINGSSLSSTFTLAREPRIARFNPATGAYTQDTIGIAKPTTPFTLAAVTRLTITGVTAATPIVITSVAHGLSNGNKVPIAQVVGVPEANGTFIVANVTANTFELVGTVGTGAYVSGGYVFPSEMRAGGYNVRVTAKNTLSRGFSQPTDVIAPITLTANQSIRLTNNAAMSADQDAYDIYVTPFQDNSTTTIEARFMGPWYFFNGTNTDPNTSVTAADLIDGSHATGRETGASYVFSYSDAEVVSSRRILTFDHFTPVDAEFVEQINTTPVWISCLGKGNSGTKQSTSPGPAAVPGKPSNFEAVLLDKTFTTAEADYIVGSCNINARIYGLCQNSLQTLVLTTVDEEPVAWRSLWNTGFRNPYNVVPYKNYIYGFSTQKIVRSVAGGDNSTVEFEFALDTQDYVANWPTGHILAAYDPKNRAICFFYAAAEKRSDYWVTICLPFMLDKQVWNPPIVLSIPNSDFIVSGVATVGDFLYFVAGGRTSGGSIVTKTYQFDGGDSNTKTWYLAWDYSDNGVEHYAKTIKGCTVTGRFANAPVWDTYGVSGTAAYDVTGLAAGTSPNQTKTLSAASTIKRQRFNFADYAPYNVWTSRLSGSYTTTVDRFDELNVEYAVNASKN